MVQRKQKPINAPPALSNPEAEMAVLGRILLDPTIYHDVSLRLDGESFTLPIHAAIFRAMEALTREKKHITQAAILSQVGEVQGSDISISACVPSLVAYARDSTIFHAPLDNLVESVAHPQARRKLIATAEWIKEQAVSAPLTSSVEDLRASAQKLITDSESASVSDGQTLYQIAAEVIDVAHKAATSGVPIGIRSGFETFDQTVGPMLPGQLIVVAGETSSGKTALCMQIAYMVAEQGHHVRVTSLEMTSQEIGVRYMTRFAAVPSEKIMAGTLTSRELDGMMVAGDGFRDLPLLIDDAPRQSVAAIQAKTARHMAIYNTKLGIIDHLQYVKPEASGEEREQIRQVVDDIKAMAKRLGIPIILVSHIVRPAEFRQINRASDIKLPSLNSLYGSSAIEKAADSVVFVHRPYWYLTRNKPLPNYIEEHTKDANYWMGKAQLILQKRRMGPGTSTRQCGFDERTTWFNEDRMLASVGMGF